MWSDMWEETTKQNEKESEQKWEKKRGGEGDRCTNQILNWVVDAILMIYNIHLEKLHFLLPFFRTKIDERKSTNLKQEMQVT
jgi:hypothetical protein